MRISSKQQNQLPNSRNRGPLQRVVTPPILGRSGQTRYLGLPTARALSSEPKIFCITAGLTPENCITSVLHNDFLFLARALQQFFSPVW